MRKLLIAILVGLFAASCGGSLQSNSGAPNDSDFNQVNRSYLVFDPFSKNPEDPIGIPFPNDILWAGQNNRAPSANYVHLDTSRITDPAKKALFEAINQLHIKGLSPNTPIIIPLSSEKPLDFQSLSNKFLLVDLTVLQEIQQLNYEYQINHSPELLAEIKKLSKKLLFGFLAFGQEQNYLKFYPLKPLEAGHQYLFVLLNGIKDKDGKTVLPPKIYEELEGNQTLSNPDLETLREKYQYLYDTVFPALSQILGIELNRNTVLEAFTFTTADKTLSVKDLSNLEKYLLGETEELSVTGLSYSNVTSDYGNFDPVSFQPDACLEADQTNPLTKVPLCALLRFIMASNLHNTLNATRTFPAFDITKLQELFEKLSQNQTVNIGDYANFIPVFFGNLNNYNGTVYIFQHGLGGNREQAGALTEDISLPVVAIDLPFHGNYTKLTQNSSSECGEGKCFLTSNAAKNRLNIYQSIFNLRLLELLLRSGVYDLNGDGTPDKAQHVYFLGVSMGAIVGSMYAKFGNPEKVVFNVGGANLISILDSARNQLIEKLLQSSGIKKNTNGYAVLLGVSQLILDPADPVYLGTDNSTNVILQNAYGDTVVPFVSNSALATKIGFENFTSLSTEGDFSSPPPSPGWYLFGNETNYVHHGFLIHTNLETYPELEGHTTLDYVKKAQKAARLQIEEFFNQN